MLEIKKIKKVRRILDKEVKVLTRIKPFAIVMIITNIFVRHVATSFSVNKQVLRRQDMFGIYKH